MKNVIYGLWCICHPEDGIRYIGQTSQGVNVRLSAHKAMVRHNLKIGKSLSYSQNWIAKHGDENIYATVLDSTGDPTELDYLEELWIRELMPDTNLRTGGLSARGWKMPEHTKQSKRGANNPMYGKDRKELMAYARSFQTGVSQETRAKMSASHKGLIKSEETKARLSASLKAALAPGTEAHGRRKERLKGEGNPATHLTEDNIREIRRLREEDGLLYREIGVMFDISQEQASMICRRKSWAHVE